MSPTVEAAVCLRYHIIDDNDGGGVIVIRARGLSNDDRCVGIPNGGGGQGVDEASMKLYTMTEAAGICGRR